MRYKDTFGIGIITLPVESVDTVNESNVFTFILMATDVAEASKLRTNTWSLVRNKSVK